MIDSIFDLLDVIPNPIPANAVPYFDGCDWKLIQMPEGVSCADLLGCLSSDVICGFLSSPNGSISINPSNGQIDVNTNWLNTNIPANWTAPILTIGNNSFDLSDLLTTSVYWTVSDGNGNSLTINNLGTLPVQGIEGMVFQIDTDVNSPTYNKLIVGLPTDALVPAPYTGALIPGPRQHGQVLTWDAHTNTAYWANNNCCVQILTFDPATDTLHISGGNSVYLGNIDDQKLDLNGNLLSIENGNTVDLSNVNNHTLQINGDQLSVINSDGSHVSTVTLPSFDCDDVMQCAGIQSIISQLQVMTQQIADIESNIQDLWDAINGN